MSRPIIIIGGPCSSGKSFLASRLAGITDSAVLHLDDYSIPRSKRAAGNLPIDNHDAPATYDHAAAVNAIRDWCSGGEPLIPCYDLATSEVTEYRSLQQAHSLVVEGLFALYDEPIRTLGHHSVYVHVSTDLMLARRIYEHRHFQSVDACIEKHFATVLDGYRRYVAPTARFADLVLDLGCNGDDLRYVNDARTELAATAVAAACLRAAVT